MDSFIKWVGGKKLLREQIIKEFPLEMDRYIEVFACAGWVLFARDKHAKFEVFNDIDSELINLYRCIKYHSSELKRELNLILHSREVFYNTKNSLDMPGLTDIQRAAKYFVLISSSFSGKRESYATGVVDLTKKIARFDEITQRLSRVIIENRDFEQILKVYDRENALFYLDPPYYQAEKYYSTEFPLDNHIRLKKCLEEIKGKFVLSYNAHPYIEELYKDFNIIKTKRFNNLSSKNGDYEEFIIKNF